MHSRLRTVSIGALGAMVATALLAQSPLSIQSDGIQFPDDTVQTTADPRRSFYLTDQGVTAIGALFLCADGYRFASLWEIHDVSNLRYAAEHPAAQTLSDSGGGPPSSLPGWVRTGTLAFPTGSPGTANCDAWTSLSGSGTTVMLARFWDGSDSPPAVDWLGPWVPGTAACNLTRNVWCIQD